LKSEYDDAPIAVDLTEPDRVLLVRGLNQWGGPARCSEPLAMAMGFDDLSSFRHEQRRLIEALKRNMPLSPKDWLRSLAATEITFASSVLGSALDWRICTGLADDETLKVLRGLQQRLLPTLAHLGRKPPPDSEDPS
jgi:predicted Abi (CAAX) family protease